MPQRQKIALMFVLVFLFVLAACAPGPNTQNLIPPTPTPCVTATPLSAQLHGAESGVTTQAGTSLPQEGSSTQPTLSPAHQATLEAGLSRANPGAPLPVCPTATPTPQK